MRYRTFTSLITAAALTLAPTAAFARSAPLPAPTIETGAQLSDDDDDDQSLIFLLLGGAAVAALVYFLLIDDGGNNDDEGPTSP